jgi:hypothetical protein
MLTCKTIDCPTKLENIQQAPEGTPIYCGLCGVEMTANE